MTPSAKARMECLPYVTAAVLLFPSAQPLAADGWIMPSDFCPNPTVVTFEGPTTALPQVPGLTFVSEGQVNDPDWFQGGGGQVYTRPIDGPFGIRIYENVVSITFSDLAVRFSPPVEAAGGYIGAFAGGIHPTQLTVRFLDAAGNVILATTTPLPRVATLFDDFPVDAAHAPLFVGAAYRPGIARIEWIGGNTGGFGVDNLTFGRTACVASTVSTLDGGMVTVLLLLVLVTGALHIARPK